MKGQVTGKCSYCGAPTRRKYELGKGKGSRAQHPKWHICENGHQIYRKRGQA